MVHIFGCMRIFLNCSFSPDFFFFKSVHIKKTRREREEIFCSFYNENFYFTAGKVSYILV